MVTSVKDRQKIKKRPPSQHHASSSTMTEQAPQNLRILVADDDSSFLDLFRQVLSPVKTDHKVHLEAEESEGKHPIHEPSLSFDLVTCRQGDEAVHAVKQSIEEDRPFSVAFIDIRMPSGPDGIWTAEHIRRLDANVEILIMTGYSDAHPRDIIRRVPPAHKLLYIQKPFQPREIFQFASALSMKWYTECELQNVNKGLERCVEDRIQEFKKVDKKLQIELIERQQTQEALLKSKASLRQSLKVYLLMFLSSIRIRHPRSLSHISLGP
jgi:two-component system cell cycle sensor histidine kinase/response regulator CckA